MPDAKWWPALEQSSICHCVQDYQSGTQLFTVPSIGNGQHRVMNPTRWGVIMVLLGKPAVAGMSYPWELGPPTEPPTIMNAPAAQADPEASAMHVLIEQLTETQARELQCMEYVISVGRCADCLPGT